MKKVLVANSFPSLGKVGLSITTPLLSAAQVEVVPLPTIVLSSHTGGFSGIATEHLENFVEKSLKQWQGLSLDLDAVLVGYCPSSEQLRTLVDFSRENELPLFLDPVMADRGQFYKGFDHSHLETVREVLPSVNLLLPNVTEACFLAGISDLGEHYTETDVENLLNELKKLTPADIVLTGVSFKEGDIGFAYFNGGTCEVSYFQGRAWPAHFYGTGDLVSALLTLAKVEEIDLGKALDFILHLLDQVLEATLRHQSDLRYGLEIEPYLSAISQKFETLKEKTNEK